MLRKVVTGAESLEFSVIGFKQLSDHDSFDSFAESIANGVTSIDELVSRAQSAEAYSAQYTSRQLIEGDFKFLVAGKDSYMIMAEKPCDCGRYCSLCLHDDEHNGQK